MVGLMVSGITVARPEGGPDIISDISFQIAGGQLLCVVGPSGCGKTTLLRAIAGIIKSTGKIEVNGKDVSRLRPDERNIGLASQDPVLFDTLTVEENVGFVLDDATMPKRVRNDQIAVALARMNLLSMATAFPSSLSGGQAGRLSLARLFAQRPAVMLLDESFAHVEATLKRNVQRAFTELIERLQIPAILVTHNLDEACELSDQLLVLTADGRIGQQGQAREVYTRPANPRVASFLGIENILSAKLLPDVASAGRRWAQIGRWQVELPAERPAENPTVYLPAEEVLMSPVVDGDKTILAGQIINCAFSRSRTFYDVETEVGTIVASTPSRQPELPIGVRVGLRAVGGWLA